MAMIPRGVTPLSVILFHRCFCSSCMSLSEAIPWLSRSGPRRFVLETCRAAWKSSPDITVVRIDEEETSIVTWEYVALMRYMVYNMKLVHPGQASRTLSGRTHRTHR